VLQPKAGLGLALDQGFHGSIVIEFTSS
jgi:hypothetical protein